ncbi:hypothetical protein HUJ05_001659 [Dendroctonus ponderosae]|nr:hypothetical protein HUJ05_001659 [Dendroctonus ponderosae]
MKQWRSKLNSRPGQNIFLAPPTLIRINSTQQFFVLLRTFGALLYGARGARCPPLPTPRYATVYFITLITMNQQINKGEAADIANTMFQRSKPVLCQEKELGNKY